MADRSRVEILLGLPAGTPDNIVAAVIDDECERRGLNALMAEHGHVSGYRLLLADAGLSHDDVLADVRPLTPLD